VAQEVVPSQSSQRRRKGTIASRYLEAIGIHCGGNPTVNTSKNAYRSTPIRKTKNDFNFDNEYHSFRDINKNKSVYDKISSTAKAADCSKSIITASTTVMLDHSDSMSTTATSPGGSGVGKHQRSSPQRRSMRRGRSPTVNRTGTNSDSNSSSRDRGDGNRTINEGSNHSIRTNNLEDCNHEYVHLPGSRSTAPLSDGVASAPSSPNRFNERRNQYWEGQRSTTKSWSDHTGRSYSSNNRESGSPITPLTAKSIMGIDNSISDSDCGSGDTSRPDSRLGLTCPPNMNNGHNRGSELFSKTSPRRPSDSPGPQPRSPRQYAHAHAHAQHQEQEQVFSRSLFDQEQGFSRSLFDQTPNTADSTQYQHQREDDLSCRSSNNPHTHHIEEAFEAARSSSPYQSEPTDSEVTETIKNNRFLHRPSHLRRPSAGADEISPPSSPSSHYQSEPTNSEAGAPTEIMKNHRTYHCRRPSSGDGGSQVLLKDRDRSRSNSNNILSRVRNRFHNQYQGHQQQQQPQNNSGKVLLPSLLDAQSSSVSSALPMAAAQAEGANSSILSPSPAFRSSSRLSRHVENARKQSIWTPSASETTSIPASLDNETNASSFIIEIGTSRDHRLGAKPLSSLLSAKTSKIDGTTEVTAPKHGGLQRRPVGGQVAALQAQYRKGKFTVRGARSQPHNEVKEKQQTEHEEEEHLYDDDFPDPILSASYTMDDNERQNEEKDDQADDEDVEDVDEWEDSDEDSVNNSYDSQDYEMHEDDDEESTLSGYDRNQNDGVPVTPEEGKDSSMEFIAYNDRQTPNTDGVFKFQSKDKSQFGKKVKKKKVHKSRARDKGGKSSIQPLFSSERLDENHMASIHESSIRSMSLGRSTKTANNRSSPPADSSKDKDGVNSLGLPRRSKSLSERNHHHDHQPLFSAELSEALRTITRNRINRSKSKSRSKQGAPHKPVPGNIVVTNETSKAGEGAEASRSKSSLTRSSTPSAPSQASRSLGANEFSSSEAGVLGEPNAKTLGKQEVSPKDLQASIKNKIRAFNLKKSRSGYNSTGIQSHEKTSIDRKSSDAIQDSYLRREEHPRGQRNLSKRTGEEKEEDGNAIERLDGHKEASSVKTMRNKLEYKSLWAQYLVESGKNGDESVSSTHDDYSVQSLRKQLEQKISSSQNDQPFDEEDDDRSVRSLRDMFEPSTKKQTGETINNLKARFERKPKGSRLSFTKRTILPRKGIQEIEESNLKTEGNGKEQIREEPDSTERNEGTKKNEIDYAAEEKSQYHERSNLKDKDSPQVNKNVQTSPMFKTVHNQLNDWSKRRQIERKSIVMHPVEERQNSNNSNSNIGGTPPCELTKGNEFVSEQQQIFGVAETRLSPLKDNNRTVPGYHWTSQNARSDHEHLIQKKGTKESSSGSEYSDAVTLDPSFADVSALSNPSALMSPDTDGNSDASSSILFENLEHKAFDGNRSTSNAELALPELNELGRETNNRRTNSSNSNVTYRHSNVQNVTQSSSKTVMKSSQMQITEDFPRVVTPDSGYDSRNGVHSFNSVDNVNPHDQGYGAFVVRNDMLSGSQRAVTPVRGSRHHSAHDMSNQGLATPNRSNRSHRVLESPNHSSRTMDTPYQSSEASSRSMENSYPSQTMNAPYQSSEASSRSMENSYRGVDSSNRSSRSPDSPLKGFESSYLSSPFEDNLRKEAESSYRSSEPTDAPQQVLESSYRSSRPLDNPHLEIETSNRSSRSSESPQGFSETSYRSSRSMGTPHREVESSIIPTQSSDTPWLANFQDNSSYLSNRQTPNPLDSEVQKDYSPSRDVIRGQSSASRHNLLDGTSRPSSKPTVAPPLPSPFDENYAAIMESRHKMLVVRQRALITRRSHRQKLQNSQQGIFGRTKPENIDANRPPSSRNYRDPRSSAEDTDRSEHRAHNTSRAGNPSNVLETPAAHSKEERQHRSPVTNAHGPRRAKEKNKVRSPHTPVASIFSRIRPTFGISPASRDKGRSQKQAVMNRISAVRAARLRRNHAYGEINNSSNNYEDSQAYRPEKVSISDPVPAYQYYPHDDSRTRDDDQSLSTRESNPQEYAAEISVD
jgi:hypothetical protein